MWNRPIKGRHTPKPGKTPVREEILEAHLSGNLHLLQLGPLKLVQRQYRIVHGLGSRQDTQEGRIDILASRPDGGFVVVELKCGIATPNDVAQLATYVATLKHQHFEKSVIGVLVAPSIDARAEAALSLTIDLNFCRVDVSVDCSYTPDSRPVPPTNGASSSQPQPGAHQSGVSDERSFAEFRDALPVDIGSFDFAQEVAGLSRVWSPLGGRVIGKSWHCPSCGQFDLAIQIGPMYVCHKCRRGHPLASVELYDDNDDVQIPSSSLVRLLLPSELGDYLGKKQIGELLHKLQIADQLWTYDLKEARHNGPCGSSGVLLIRGGYWVDYVATDIALMIN